MFVIAGQRVNHPDVLATLCCHSVGDVFASGRMTNVVAVASGTGTLTVDGVNGSVTVNLNGIGSLYVNPTSGEVQ